MFVCLMLVACGHNDGGDAESSKIESNTVESSNESSIISTNLNEESSVAESNEISEVSSQGTEASTEPTLGAWKQAYIDYIEGRFSANTTYNLVYVDNDNIPELYIGGFYEEDGDTIISYKNGNIVSLHFDNCGSGRYIEKKGLLYNDHGIMSYFYTRYICIYKLDSKGFSNILDSYIEQSYNSVTNKKYEYFYINEKEVTMEEYEKALNNAFNISKSKELAEKRFSFNEIKQKILSFQ